MPYNKVVMDGLLPDPGFSDKEDLKEKMGSTFGSDGHITKSAFVNICSAMVGANRKKTDDLTFIIPYSTSDEQRKWCMMATVAWILCTTTAKIILFSAESEKTFKIFSSPENLAPGASLTWEQFSGKDVSDEAKRRYIFTEIHNEICLKIMAAGLMKDEFNTIVHGDENFANQFFQRVETIVETRKDDEPFHRTRYLNMMLDKVGTNFVCNHDADTLLSSHGLMSSLSFLRFGLADVVYPYERGIRSQKRLHFKEAAAPGPLNTLILTGDMSLLLHDDYGILEWPASYGQSIILNTEKYKSVSGENEEFVSWGAEDLERYSRFVRLGLKVARVDAPVVHLEHPRGADSSSLNKAFDKNEKLCQNILEMSTEELQKYYGSIGYRKKYSW